MSSNHFIPGRRFYDPEAAPPPEPPSKVCRSVIGGTEVAWLRDVPKGRKIHGTAITSSIIESHKLSLVTNGMEAEIPVPLFSEHDLGGDPIGEVYHIEKTDSQIYVRARLFDNAAADHAWSLINQGETQCFSVGVEEGHVQGIVDGVKFVDKWRLRELSVCRMGGDPHAGFEILSLI